jgi:hypothetical protein
MSLCKALRQGWHLTPGPKSDTDPLRVGNVTHGLSVRSVNIGKVVWVTMVTVLLHTYSKSETSEPQIVAYNIRVVKCLFAGVSRNRCVKSIYTSRPDTLWRSAGGLHMSQAHLSSNS